MTTELNKRPYGISTDNSGFFKHKSFFIPPDIIEKESKNEILSNLQLTWAGCYTKAAGHLVKNRCIRDHVIIYCVDGGGWLLLNKKYWNIKKGDLFICPPDVEHSYGADSKEPWTKYWIHFRGKNAGYYMGLLDLSLDSPVLHVGENIALLSRMQDIFNILLTGYSLSNLLLSTSHLMNILCYISSLNVNMALYRSKDINVQNIIAYMLDNLDKNLSLIQMAQYANVSKYHFIREFKDKVGYTPIDYYIRLKIQKACELLESSSLKINGIYSELGFSNAYYFSITFKRITGLSPLRYREKLK